MKSLQEVREHFEREHQLDVLEAYLTGCAERKIDIEFLAGYREGTIEADELISHVEALWVRTGIGVPVARSIYREITGNWGPAGVVVDWDLTLSQWEFLFVEACGAHVFFKSLESITLLTEILNGVNEEGL